MPAPSGSEVPAPVDFNSAIREPRQAEPGSVHGSVPRVTEQGTADPPDQIGGCRAQFETGEVVRGEFLIA